MKKIAIIQARMGSTRYFGKVLHDVQGDAVLAHIVHRIKKAKIMDGIVVATTVLERDDAVAEAARKISGVTVFRGDEKDVLGRFVKAGAERGADYVVRVCGDCPFIDPAESAKVVSTVTGASADYGSNKHAKGVVSGAGIEVISMKCLERLDKEAKEPIYREHVTNYIVEGKDSGKFDKIFIDADICNNCPELDLSIDTAKDIEDLDKLAVLVRDLKDSRLETVIKCCRKEGLFGR